MPYYDKEFSVEVLPITQIDLGDRARKDLKDVYGLAMKIKDKGLINPITVYQRSEGFPEGQPFLLLAGGRRLKAHQILEYDKIPCRIYDRPLSEEEILTIELSENIDREDLDFAEECRLKEKIMKLQIMLHGEKTSTKQDAPGASLRTVAKSIGVSHATLANDLKIAQAMNQFPELQLDKLKNKTEALKIIENIGNSVNRVQRAQQAEKTIGTGNKLKKTLMDSYIVGDFFLKAQELPDKYFNLVEVDPPYGIDLTKVKKGYNGKYSGYNEVDQKDYGDFIHKVIFTCYKKMAQDSWFILWFAQDPWFDYIKHTMSEAGFGTTGLCGIWVKGQENEDAILKTSGQSHKPNSRLANAYEMFFYGWKGNPTLGKPGSTNVFGYKPVLPGKKSHPTERPLELMVDLVCTFGKEGDKVLVPFAGSGVSLIAALQSKMHPIGFDLTQTYKDSFVLRVDKIF